MCLRVSLSNSEPICSDVDEKSSASFLMQNNRTDTPISFRIKWIKTNK